MAVRYFNPPDGGTTRRASDLPYIKGCFESWARWSHGSNTGEISLTGRLMQGARPPLCPLWLRDISDGVSHDPACQYCGGKGRVRLDDRHRAKPRICSVCEGQHPVIDGKIRTDLPTVFCGNVCFRCRGAGFVIVRLFDVNPVTIRSTRHVGGKPPPDVCLLLEDLVTGWREMDSTVWLSKVVTAEYFWRGDQDGKARDLHVSVSFYEKRIREAYYLTEQMLDEKMP